MRIIVADDEIFARKAIVKMLREVEPEAEICLEAETGQEILDYMKDHSADLILTDIRMPEKDGLEVAECIQKTHSEANVAIISGYADFAYASAAIRFGVKDYLTKPVRREELEEMLGRIRNQHARKRQAVEREVESRIERAGMHYMDPERVFRQEGLTKMLLAPEVLEKLRSSSWRMTVIRPQEHLQGWSRERVGEQMEYFRSHLEQMEVWDYFFIERDEFVLLTRPARGRIAEDYLPQALNRMLQALLRDRKICFTAGISAEHTGTALVGAYREAVLAVCGRLLGGAGKSYSYDQSGSGEAFFGERGEQLLKKALLENRREDAKSLADEALNAHKTQKGADVNGMFRTVMRMLGVIDQVFEEREQQDGREYEDTAALLFSVRADLYSFQTGRELQEYLHNLMDKAAGEEKEQKGDIVDQVLAYVRDNYQYDMTLTDLANRKFFMNSSYLSRLFKARTGQTFSKYLISYRMKKAAELLLNESFRIGDVAQYVGYNDTSYFIQTFKKYYDMTPEQYRIVEKE